MTTPLIVPGICRFTLQQEMAGVDLVNILDMHIVSVGGSARADNCERQAGRIINAWYDNLRAMFVDDLSLTSVDWIDLDSAAGSVGSRTSTDAHVLPQSGTSAGAPFPSFAAMRLTKATVASRGARVGRLFQAGIQEAWTLAGDPNNLNPALFAEVNANYAAFKEDIESTGAGIDPDYESHLVVVHIPKVGDPSYTNVTAITVDGKVSHQVRRAS